MHRDSAPAGILMAAEREAIEQGFLEFCTGIRDRDTAMARYARLDAEFILMTGELRGLLERLEEVFALAGGEDQPAPF